MLWKALLVQLDIIGTASTRIPLLVWLFSPAVKELREAHMILPSSCVLYSQ